MQLAPEAARELLALFPKEVSSETPPDSTTKPATSRAGSTAGVLLDRAAISLARPIARMTPTRPKIAGILEEPPSRAVAPDNARYPR